MPTHLTLTTKKASLPHHNTAFSLLDAFPQPIGVRDKTLDLLFLNKSAETNNVFIDVLTNYYEDRGLQNISKEKAAILFQKRNSGASHTFEIVAGDRYFKVHQAIEKLPSGERVLIETLKDITEEKTNALALSLMSITDNVKDESEYLDYLTQSLATIFDLTMVTIAITNPGEKQNTTLSCWLKDKHIANFSYDLEGAPCGRLYETKEALFIPSQIQVLFPTVKFLKTNHFETFFRLPLFNLTNEIIGIVAVADTKAFKRLPLLKKVLEKLIPKLSMEVSARMRLQELEVNKAWTKQAIDSYQNGLCVFDKDYKLRLFNKPYSDACKRQHGITVKKGEAVLDQVAEVIHNGHNTSTTINELNKRKDWLQMAFNGQHHTQYIKLTKEGTTTNFALSYHPIYNYNNTNVKEVLLISHDITELINSQNELKQYIESNMKLENLAYSACHDLKEPLRTIGTFTQIIQKKYEHLIDEKSKEYMGFIVNGVTRMNNFVDALFTYSRVKENQHDYEPFSISQVVEYLQLDLNQTIQEKNATISLENIPETITANRTKIKQLFQNLIANALKFQQADLSPNIQIVGSETKSHWQFSISDNGIGIPEEHFDQIFTLFRKLHSRDQYEGSGIGLALCKEIVEQHKGLMTVESEEGKGTRFKFSIKKGLGEGNE